MKGYLFGIISIFLFYGCKKDNSDTTAEASSAKTVLFYIAANNDLRLDALESLNKIKMGYKFNPNHRILIYLKTESNKSHLLALRHHGVDTLYSFGNDNSSDPKFFKKVISYAQSVYSSQISGIVLWSHATSWKPKPKMKSFGQDEGIEMDIKELAKALPDNMEFLVFDACTMASIEVLYEFKNKTKYILASPAEILSTSFPYDNSINELFLGIDGLEKAAANFLSYYENQTGLYQSATISLVQTDKLESIARETSKLLLSKTLVYPFNKEKIQQLTFERSGNVPSYDYISVLRNNYTYNEFLSLERAIQEAVLFKGSTKLFLGNEIVDYCGLTVYLPESDDPYFDYYSSLQWNSDSGWSRIFKGEN